MGQIRKTPGLAAQALNGGLDWDDLRVFLAIAKAGSLTGAARALKSTQPTVSRRLDALEGRLGVQLVQRGGDGIVLTPAGAVVADHAESMQRLAAAMQSSVAQKDREACGEVTISAPDGLAAHWLVPALKDFQRAWPHISIALDTATKEPLHADMRISFTEAKRMDDVAVPLGWVHYVALAADEYLTMYGAPTNLMEAFRHRVLLHSGYREQVERWMAKARSMHDIVEPGLVTDDSTALLNAASFGLGVAVMPSYAAALNPQLKLVDVGVLARLRFWLIFDRNRGDVARCRRVIEWIKTVFAAKRNPWFREEFIPPSEFAAALERERA